MKRLNTLFLVGYLALTSLMAAPEGTIPARPSRIVAAGKAVVFVADALYLFPEARGRVVAVAKADQGLGQFLQALDPAFPAKPPLDRSAGAEAIAALGPDLVLAKSSNRATLGPGLDALGIAQLYLDLETPEDYLRELAVLGGILGEGRRAAELVAYYRGLLERVGSALTGLPPADKPRVLVLQATPGTAGSYELPPAAWMQTILVERAGGVPLWKDANPGSGWARVGAEQIAAWNPDAVFVIAYGGDSSAAARAFRSDPRFSSTRAAATGRVLGFPQDFYSWDQPDTRWGLGFLWLAKRLHPARFPALSLRAEAERFFSLGYGLDKARFEGIIAPRLKGDLE